MQIEKNSASLSSIIREATGENLSLYIGLKEIKVENPEEHAPLEVRILCDTFKGHIVGYSVKTAEEIERSKKEDSEKPADKEEDSQNSSESQSESAENTENMENDDSENE